MTKDKRFNRMQWRMLIATMIGYTLFYFMRKNFSFAMPGLEQDCGISKSMLGNFLFAGGLVYGVSKFVNGMIGDKVNPKKMLCFGLAVCVVINIVFGFAPQLAAGLVGGSDAAGYMSALAWMFGGLFVLNQFFQGTGFPPCAKLIAYWIPPKELATKMSVWNTSHSIGGGLVAKVCGVIMGLGVIGAANQGVGMWKWCFWVMAVLGVLGLVAMWLWLPGTPEDEGLATNVETSPNSAEEKPDACPCDGVELTMAKAVFLNPVIWVLGLCNFSINAVRSLVADWGPTLLQEAKGFTPSQSGDVIMFFEFAGIAGMLLAGWATDRWFGGRAPRLCVFLMALTAGLFATFWFLPSGIAGASALCAAGLCLYGPQALTGVTAMNSSTKRYAGTSVGFISLFSYIGVSVSGKVCGTMAEACGGWQTPLMTMVVVAAVGAVFFVTIWGAKAKR